MARFYDLPLEIRRMIYRECLVVGEIYPYSLSDALQPYTETPQDKTGCEVPSVAILQVSKTIREEAEPMLYQKNVLRLGSAEVAGKFFERSLNTPERRMWLKSVRTGLDSRDITKADRQSVLENQMPLLHSLMLFPEKGSLATTIEGILHDEYTNCLVDTIWPRKLSPLLNDCKLEKLSVNLSQATCPGKCCPRKGRALLAFRKGFAYGVPKELPLVGLKDKYMEPARGQIKVWTNWPVADCNIQNVFDIFLKEDEKESRRYAFR
ncbi:hypothetical protein BDR22DRAFT_845550 [Usnea florida]